jgi:HK97 family phage portal protein
MANFLTKAFGGMMRSFDLDTFAGLYTKSEMYAWFNVLDGLDSSAVLSSLKAFRQSTWVNKCVNVISASGAMLPLEVYKGTQKLESHPLLDFMRAPNPYLTREQLFYRTISIMLLQGECFWWIVRNGSRATNNMPEGVWILDPRIVQEQLSQTFPQTIIAWKVQTPFGMMALDPLDVAHFKIPHPEKPFRGSSPMEAAGLAISADVAAAKWNYKFFKNSALPSGILSTEQPLTETQARMIRKRWEETSKGEDNAHRIQVTYRGLKWTSLQDSRKDMEFKEQREQLQQEICAMFGVPGIKLGLLDGATYANSDAQKELFWTQTVMPLLRLIEATLDDSILRDTTLETYFNTDNVEDIRGIVARKVDTAVKMFSIGWPLNLIDKRLDIGMGDVEWGDEGFLIYTMQPVSMIIDPPKPALADPNAKPKKPGSSSSSDPNADPNEPPPAPLPTDPAKAFEYVRSRVAAFALKGSFAAQVGTAIEKFRQLAETELLPNEQPVIDVPDTTRTAIIDVLRTTNATDTLRALKTTVGVPHRCVTVYDRIFDWSPRLYVARATSKIDTVLTEIRDEDDYLQRIGAQYIKQGMTLGINSANELLGVEFNVDNPEAKKFLDDKVIKIVGINETIEEQVRAAIGVGLDANKSNDEIADLIVDVFDVADTRARTIARTEVSSSNNGGRFITFKENGVDKTAWLTSEDDRVRDSHDAVDGEEAAVGESFPSPPLSCEMQFPGDPDGDAEEVINCRCTSIPVIGNDDEEGRLFSVGYVRSLSADQRVMLWRKQVVGVANVERAFTKALKKLFRKQKADVLAAWAAAA